MYLRCVLLTLCVTAFIEGQHVIAPPAPRVLLVSLPSNQPPSSRPPHHLVDSRRDQIGLAPTTTFPNLLAIPPWATIPHVHPHTAGLTMFPAATRLPQVHVTPTAPAKVEVNATALQPNLIAVSSPIVNTSTGNVSIFPVDVNATQFSAQEIEANVSSAVNLTSFNQTVRSSAPLIQVSITAVKPSANVTFSNVSVGHTNMTVTHNHSLTSSNTSTLNVSLPQVPMLSTTLPTMTALTPPPVTTQSPESVILDTIHKLRTASPAAGPNAQPLGWREILSLLFTEHRRRTQQVQLMPLHAGSTQATTPAVQNSLPVLPSPSPVLNVLFAPEVTSLPTGNATFQVSGTVEEVHMHRGSVVPMSANTAPQNTQPVQSLPPIQMSVNIPPQNIPVAPITPTTTGSLAVVPENAVLAETPTTTRSRQGMVTSATTTSVPHTDFRTPTDGPLKITNKCHVRVTASNRCTTFGSLKCPPNTAYDIRFCVCNHILLVNPSTCSS